MQDTNRFIRQGGVHYDKDYVSPNEVGDDDVILDVRSPSEYHTAHIPESYNIPLESIDEYKDDLRQLSGVLVCRTDNRSSKAWDVLKGVGADVAVLKNGINAWQDAGREMYYGDSSTWSVQRQVQFIAGSLGLVGTVLGSTVSSWFLLLPGVVGAGLTVAGLTGTCAMANALRHAPWNEAESVTEEHVAELTSTLK